MTGSMPRPPCAFFRIIRHVARRGKRAELAPPEKRSGFRAKASVAEQASLPSARRRGPKTSERERAEHKAGFSKGRQPLGRVFGAFLRAKKGTRAAARNASIRSPRLPRGGSHPPLSKRGRRFAGGAERDEGIGDGGCGFPRQYAHWLGMTESLDLLAVRYCAGIRGRGKPLPYEEAGRRQNITITGQKRALRSKPARLSARQRGAT